MSLVDDARELADALGRREDGLCHQCGKREGHWDSCPFPEAEVLMPKIVAALEAVDGALRDLTFLSHPYFREDYLAVLSLADRVRSALLKSKDEPS